MTPAARWALVAGVMVLAVIAVMLPRVGGGEDEPADADRADLAAAREAAALPACPEPAGEPRVGALDGVRSVCLGDGVELDVGAALSGTTTLVNLWATWCAPCRDELPVLSEYAQSDGAVEVLLVQVESDAGDGLELLAELGVRLPSLFDGTDKRGPVATALQAPPSLPATYLVTEDGTVTFIENPRLLTSVELVKETVQRYLDPDGVSS